MSKRRLQLAGIVVVAASIAVGTLAALSARPCVAEIKCRQVQYGMSLEAVNAIMGKPGARKLEIGHNLSWHGTWEWQFADGSSANVEIDGPNIFAIGERDPGTGVFGKRWTREAWFSEIRKGNWPWR